MKEGRKPEYPEKTPDDDLQKMPHTKARRFKPQARLEPAQQHWWQARKADVLIVAPRVAPYITRLFISSRSRSAVLVCNLVTSYMANHHFFPFLFLSSSRDQCRDELISSYSDNRLVGLVVKASAWRAKDPGFESRLRQDFSGVESYQWLKNWHSSGYPARRLAW